MTARSGLVTPSKAGYPSDENQDARSGTGIRTTASAMTLYGGDLESQSQSTNGAATVPTTVSHFEGPFFSSSVHGIALPAAIAPSKPSTTTAPSASIGPSQLLFQHPSTATNPSPTAAVGSDIPAHPPPSPDADTPREEQRQPSENEPEAPLFSTCGRNMVAQEREAE